MIKAKIIRRIKRVIATLNKRSNILSPDEEEDDEEECSCNDKGGVTNRSMDE